MNDKQRVVFETLVNEELPALVASKSTDIAEDLHLSFHLIDLDVKNKITDEAGTEYAPVCAECKLENAHTTESVTFNVNLLNLPVYQELGFMIRGNYMQMLDSYDKSAGLHTMKKVTQAKDLDKAIIQSENFKSLGFYRDKSKFLTELKLKGKVSDAIGVSPCTFLRAITGMSKEELIAKFSYSNSYVITIFDGNAATYPECKAGYAVTTRNDCVRAVYAAIFGRNAEKDPDNGTISSKLNEIERWLFSENYFNKGSYATQRIRYMQSFSYRAAGKVLAKDVNANGVNIAAGTVLTAQLLRELDATELSELSITANNIDYLLHKFARYWFGAYNYTLLEDVPEVGLTKGTVLDLGMIDDLNASALSSIKVRDLDGNERTLTRDTAFNNLTLDDIFTVFDIWVNNLNDLGVYDKEFDLTNRVLYPFDKRVLNIVNAALDTIIKNITNKYNVKGSTADLNDYIENFDKNIKVEEFIDQIRSPELKLGQMAEMCNIMSFTSKDYKSTIANLKNIDDNLVTIQDHQYGRTDAFDIPESSKLASVQYRTMYSKVNDAGLITVPYLKVSNGEVVDETPVYLTAIDETDRYIAEWNETFLNEDGSKKMYVNARYNGEIVSVDVANVSYKEFSPYSGMSVSHACIPFPGHSDGKRITMGCNQLSQASPMCHSERPSINGGGESMIEYGFYTTDKILNEYYNNLIRRIPALKSYKDEILHSKIKLTSKHATHGNLRLTMHILAVKDILQKDKSVLSSFDDAITLFGNEAAHVYEIEVPYALQTTDNTLLSYNIAPKPNNIYDIGDVLCYSNSCSPENKEHADFMDTGADQIGTSDFSKGLALVKELRIGYKTWSGSTIDDAMVISDECVYGDILTSIFTSRITLSAKSFSNTEYEEFGIMFHKYPYFEGNGLPRIGTYLNAGDPVIAKISHNASKTKEKYRRLKVNQSGQVVYAGFTKKNGEVVAEVVLAQRNVTEIGDKYAGRCGNKGVVAKIVPAEQMPFDPETGFRLQAILNPLGVPSRNNASQFLDLDSTECMRRAGKMAYVSPYNEKDLEWVLNLKEIYGVKPKIFIDGRTGKPFERPIHWGTLPMYKLHHVIKKKYHAIGLNAPVDPVYMQPRQGSKMDGGQSFGEMEAWCLMSVGAKNVLQEIYSYQSTDIKARNLIRLSLEGGDDVIQDVKCNNSNNATMLACYRSLGIEFKTNTDDKTFEFHPLTTKEIQSFSAMPVDNPENLHNAAIFKGNSYNLAKKDSSRDNWGWIDLKTELIHPNFIQNSRILSLINTETEFTFNKDVAEDLMKGLLYVEAVNQKVHSFKLYSTITVQGDKRYGSLLPDTEAPDDVSLITGVEALVMMFRYMDTEYLERVAKAACDKWLEKNGLTEDSDEIASSSSFLQKQSYYHFIHEFNANETLEDYIISAFPVMPQLYRPTFANSRQTEHVDFDWHYTRILNAVSAMERNRNTETVYAVYAKIKSFCGLNKDATKEEMKHKNIKTYFSGSGSENKDHGKLRTHVQSKRVFCSGRTTIIPAHDTRMKPTEIGIPLSMAVSSYESQLLGEFTNFNNSNLPLDHDKVSELLMLCAIRDRARFDECFDANFVGRLSFTRADAYDAVTDMIYNVIENRDGKHLQVVLAGRQPSLHKYAIRAYIPKLVLENTINVHTLVCSGYNADFDGDQMWFQALISQEAKEEALKLLSPAVDYINPKDSSLILKHTQDVVLGLYCMSMLKNNATSVDVTAADIHHYQNLDQMLLDLDLDNVHTYDFACVDVDGHRYLSTIGRLYLNSVANGFTDQPFTNPNSVQGIKNENYCELKYDGIWRSGGNVKTGNFRYFKIADVCLDNYNQIGDKCLDVLQKLTELGFFYADRFCISLSLEDMMLKPVDESEKPTEQKLMDLDQASLQEICSEELNKAEELKIAIEQDYYDGLISEEDKNDAIVTLYYSGTGDKNSEFCNGVHSKVMRSIMDKLGKTQRNNNIFIMLDSGARGKPDQVMRMCGFLPQLQKDKQSSLKTPVTHSFLQGLSSFDVHMTSYGIKQGLASTQNETPDAGYATHKGVFMTSGVQVVESDCGKTDWWYDVVYDDLDDSKSKFMPSHAWFDANLCGKAIAANDTEALACFGLIAEDSVIKPENFEDLTMSGGFHSIQWEDNTILDVTIDSIIGKSVHIADKLNFVKLQNTLTGHELTSASVSLLQKLKIMKLVTQDGTFIFHYKMNSCSKSLMLHRQCKDLPFTKEIFDAATGDTISITTKKTVQYIENKNLTRVPVRILLDCKSEHGVCAHCYGLKFSSLKLPEVGDFVGTESAQAVGEPSAQLTISLINQGGTAGAAIDDGVKRFSSLLDGSVSNSAVVAPRSGYVKIDKLGEVATVSVRPVKAGAAPCCQNCKAECVDLNGLLVNTGTELPNCALKKTVNVNLLDCKDGDWVEASQPLTKLIVDPKSIELVTVSDGKELQDTKDFKYVYRHKQTVWLQNYFDTFHNKGIDINARHFEIFARIQNLLGVVYSSNSPDFKVGEAYEIASLEKADGVKFISKLSPRPEVILHTSGAMAALSFERIQSVAAKLCVNSYKSPYEYNNSLLGAVAVGTDLRTGIPKEFGVKVVKPRTKPKKAGPSAMTMPVYKEVQSKKISDTTDIFAGLDFDSLMSEDNTTPAPQEMPIPEEAPVATTVNDAEGPEAIDAFEERMSNDFVSDDYTLDEADSSEFVHSDMESARRLDMFDDEITKDDDKEDALADSDLSGLEDTETESEFSENSDLDDSDYDDSDSTEFDSDLDDFDQDFDDSNAESDNTEDTEDTEELNTDTDTVGLGVATGPSKMEF